MANKTKIRNVTITEAWAFFGSLGCSVFTFVNNSGVNAQIRRTDDFANVATIAAGMAVDINAANLSEWQVRRASGTGSLSADLIID